MNSYLKLKEKRQKEINDFPMFFAFNEKQFNEGMKKIGLNVNDKNKIYSVGMGGFIRKKDSKKLTNLFNKHDKEMQEAISKDKTGDNFIFDMFFYELNNHEYIVTRSIEDTLDALGLTVDEVNSNELLIKGLNNAIKKILEN